MLSEEVANFQRWAERYSPTMRSAEWECDYPDWRQLYQSTNQMLEQANGLLTPNEIELLLFVLARDNEGEHILERLAAYPNLAMQLAEAAVEYPDHEARWQVAVLLGRIRTREALALLQHFTRDDDEYVRRRAGLAMRAPDP